MTGEEPTTKVKNQYFFPGGGEFIPQNVEAESLDEAQKEYEKTRKPYNKLK